MFVKVDNISKMYKQNGSVFHALKDVNLEIEKGEFICLLGPSGCGKTTLINILAGFESASTGSALIDNKKVTEPSLLGVTIFQNYGLLPWRTVRKNIELGLEAKGLSRQEIHETSQKYLELVNLTQFSNHHPSQLSGGMRQRVAIAAALAVNPEIIFMDEPLGSLDALTRMEMQDEVLKIQKTQKKTVIFVTHDIEEAVFLADRVVLMTPNPGKIKSIININLGDHRDRTSSDFLALRGRIFFEFELNHPDKTEYFI